MYALLKRLVKFSPKHFVGAVGLGLLLSLSALIVPSAFVHAADSTTDSLTTVGDATGLGNEDPKIIIGNIISYALGFIGVILVVTIVYGGFVWMTAAGNPERVDKAKKILINAVVGLIIILMSWGIATFVITSLTSATGGSDSSGSSSSGGSSGFGGGSKSAFGITGFSPDEAVSIRNIVVRVTFNRAVDDTTVNGNIAITDASGTAVAGTFVTTGNVVKFTPSAVCPDPNTDRFCFDADAPYTITATTSVKSSSGTALTCSALSPCSAGFTSGSIVDTEDPSASITVPSDSVSTGGTADFQVSATDDAGVASADFLVDDEWQDSVPADGMKETAVSTIIDTTSFADGGRYTFKATVIDLAGNEDSDTVSVRARPEWCFNGVLDSDLGESGIDCGGDTSAATYCGACDGSSCIEDADCSSGSCIGSMCVSNPSISNVMPQQGAVGTYVTISGTDFGANTGTVLFTDEAGTGLVEATVLRDCGNGWSDTSIVVEVPEGAGDGPITLTTGNKVSDSTDDDNGVLVPNFDVNDVVSPNLCSLSQDSGRSDSALTLTGSNFGETQGKSTVLFSTTSAGSYTSWNGGTVQVTVPNASAGSYDVAVVVGGHISNTLPYEVTVAGADISTITDISPGSGGIGQYVTISGTNFGASIGTVTLTSRATGDTATGSVAFPAACSSDYWSDDQVLIIIPSVLDNGSTLANGDYDVTVNNRDGRTVSTTTKFAVNSNDPTPGICSITSSGDVGESITIAGDGFGTATDTVTFHSAVKSLASTRWTSDEIDVAVPTGASTGPVMVTVGGKESNTVNFTVGDSRGPVTAAALVAGYAWSFSTGEIKEVPAVVSACDADTVSAVPNNRFSTASDICVNAVVYAEFTTLMNEKSVEEAISVEECTAAVSSSTDDPCATTSALSGVATVESSASATRVTWVPTSEFDANTTYRVTISTAAISTDAIPLLRDATWDFTTSTRTDHCVVDRVTVTPDAETLTIDGETAGFGANAGTGCVIVDSSNYTWDWSVDSYSYVDFNATADLTCVGDPTACATLQANAEGATLVTATVINGAAAGTVSDDGSLVVNFTDPYISNFQPDCTEACLNAEIGATFNTAMTVTDVTAGDHILLYSCSNELCSNLTLVDANPDCTYDDSDPQRCIGFNFGEESLTAGSYYRVIVSGDITSTSGVSLVRTNYGADYSWTFRVREDGTLCAVSRIALSPSSAVAKAIGDRKIFSVEAYGDADSCSTSGQQLVASGYNWGWADPIADDDQNTVTVGSTAEWYKQSSALFDSGSSGIESGCSDVCTPVGSSPYQAVCGDRVLDQEADGSGEECDDGNTTDHDGCSATCLNEGSNQCSFTCSSTGAACSVGSDCVEVCNKSTSLCSVSGGACASNSDCPYATATCGTTGTGCCGNANIDTSGNVSEDCDDGNLINGDGCSSTCLAEGSASVGATCGNNDVAFNVATLAGEECDDGNNSSGDGCSRQCLREGSQSLAALGGALCGDGEITTPYETCEDGNVADGDGCSSICVREGLVACTVTGQTNCCGNGVAEVSAATGAGEDCDGGEGCESSCTFGGSSLSYTVASVCGDGTVGAGEYSLCEIAGTSGDENVDASQVAFVSSGAAAEVSTKTRVAIGNVTVTEPGSSLVATAPITLSCTAESDQSCENPDIYGVGNSNCCVPRPTLVGSAPAASATNVCRNAAVYANFSEEMDTGSFITDVETTGATTRAYQMYLRLNLASGQTCPATYTTSSFLAMTWVERVLSVVKTFFLGPVAQAAATTDCVLPVDSYSQTALSATQYKVSLNYGQALEVNSSYDLVIVGDANTADATSAGVASKLGAGMRGTTTASFTTGSVICTLDAVDVDDTDSSSPNVYTTTGESHSFLATGVSYAGNTRQEIKGIPGVYDWRWTAWASTNAELFTATQSSSDLDTATVVAVGDNGDATVTATARIVENGVDTRALTGSADVTAFLCENPWPQLSEYPWSDDAAGEDNDLAAAGTSGYMNFSLGYCRDYGDDTVATDDLPGIARVVLAPALPASTDVLKEYLFEIDPDSTTASSSSAGDAIGVRVLSNADHLSPSDWYKARGFTGSPSKTTIDGLQALTDERSTYIAAPNATASGLYSNIVVISYNEGASEETQNIYEQVIANVAFMLNVADSAVCSDDGSVCSSDMDCGVPAVCGSDKLKIIRDTQRLADLQNLSLLVAAYGEENMTCSDTKTQACSNDTDCPAGESCEAIVPALSSGTDVRSVSSSAWSSWNETLGGSLGAATLVADPLNEYEACSGYDSETCVNTTTAEYICPTGSHVYHYRALGERSYGLATDLEYRSLNWVDDLEDASNDTVSFSTSGYCAGTIYGTSSLCGDGIIGASEDCETGDTNAIACTTDGGVAGTKDQDCNASCTGWTTSATAVCSPVDCGNGVVESGEFCDDGSLNGEYGYCGALCTYTGAEYCGDGLISGGEACDCGDASLVDRTNSRPYGGIVGLCAGSNGTYSATSAKSCSWDCSGSAAYCGDESVDISAGESCDGDVDTTTSAICADGMTVCSSDADCVGHGTTCGGGLNSACPATAYLCSGGTFDGYMCASPSWGIAENAVAAYYCTAVGGGTCAKTGNLYPVVHTRTCDSGASSTGTCGWNGWNFCNTNGALCGNGVADGDEECDDGNDVATDYCTNECKVNVCGDGYLYNGSEECDEGSGNGGGCSSAYGSSCTACSTSCRYTVSSGDFCGDGVINGDEYCDGSDVPYLWYNGYDSAHSTYSRTTDGACDPERDTTRTDSTTGVTYTCRAVGICNGGSSNGDYCTQSAGVVFGDDATACGTLSGDCVMPVCGADCAATCPMSQATTSLLMTSNQPGDPASTSVDMYSYDASNTSSLPNAATINVPACTTAGNLVADVDFTNVEPPDAYIVFVTDVSGSMATALSSSTRIAVARDSIKSAIGTVFDELGSGAYISLVSYDSSIKSTMAFTGEAGEAALDAAVDLYAPGASTATNLGLDQAKAYLDAVTDVTNVAKFIVLLSDGEPNDEALVDASALAVLKASGIEVYSITVNTDTNLISDMNRWSSNSVCNSAATSLTTSGGGCTTATNNAYNNIDYSYSGSTTSEVSGAYESIVDSIVSGTASVTSSDGTTVVVDTGTVSDSRNIVLPWPSSFSCDGVTEQQVPIQISFRGEGRINVSNVRVNTCTP